MSALDLTAAVEAAARAQWDETHGPTDQPWEADSELRYVYREYVLSAIEAAAPLIEAQVRESIKAEIEALIEASPRVGTFTNTGEYVTQRWVSADALRSLIARTTP